MAIKRIPSHQLGPVDLVPRALVRRSVAYLTDRLGIAFDRDTDDLDAFSAAWFRLDSLTFGFLHHDGEPADTTGLYLDRNLAPAEAHKAITKILRKFNIPPDDLAWEETENLQHLPA